MNSSINSLSSLDYPNHCPRCQTNWNNSSFGTCFLNCPRISGYCWLYLYITHISIRTNYYHIIILNEFSTKSDVYSLNMNDDRLIAQITIEDPIKFMYLSNDEINAAILPMVIFS